MTPGSRPSKGPPVPLGRLPELGEAHSSNLVQNGARAPKESLEPKAPRRSPQPFPLEGMGIHSLVKSHGAERRGSQGIVAEGRSPKEARMRAVQNPLTALEWRPGQRWPCRGR